MKRIYSVQSILGGQDFYDDNGQFVGYSVPGIGSGEDYYYSNGETGYTVDSVSLNKEKNYNLKSFFPVYVDGEQINLENRSVYIAYDEQARYFRMFVGNDKKFCNEDAAPNTKMY